MPLSLDSSGPVARVTACGDVSYAEILDLIQAMILKGPRAGSVPVFVDTRDVTEAPTTAELRLVAGEMRRLTDAGFGPIAVLTGAKWMYGIVRMFSVFAQSATDVVALRSMDEAAAWINNHVVFRDTQTPVRRPALREAPGPGHARKDALPSPP
jgi:hypothetical protein